MALAPPDLETAEAKQRRRQQRRRASWLRDLAGLAGLGCLLYGLQLVHPALAWCLAGSLLIAVAGAASAALDMIRTSRKKRKQARHARN